MTKRLYTAGSSRSMEDLAKTYERIENIPAWSQKTTEPERDVKDPLGLTAKRPKPAGTFDEGKEAAVRITKFIALVASEMELDPEQTIFGVELAALNTLNAQDCPVPQAKIAEVRKAAYEYYVASLKHLPDFTG